MRFPRDYYEGYDHNFSECLETLGWPKGQISIFKCWDGKVGDLYRLPSELLKVVKHFVQIKHKGQREVLQQCRTADIQSHRRLSSIGSLLPAELSVPQASTTLTI